MLKMRRRTWTIWLRSGSSPARVGGGGPGDSLPAVTRSRLRFDVVPLSSDPELSKVKQVVPCIDGRSLVEIVAEFEDAQGYTSRSQLGGIVPAFFKFGPLDRYYLGQHERWSGEKDVAVLLCVCGEFGCGPFYAHVTVNDDEVAWAEFHRPGHVQSDYSAIGSFAFPGSEYREAVRDAVTCLQADP